jgi:hypothetical protein
MYVSYTGTMGRAGVIGQSEGTNGGDGVIGDSSANYNTGAGVLGVSRSNSQGVGVKGSALCGSTAIWGYATCSTATAAWFDGRTFVNGADLTINTIGKGVVLKSSNGTCWRLQVTDSGNLNISSITCP